MRVSLNGNDWMYKDFIGDDWVWRHSEKPNTRDIRWWRKGLVPGSVTNDLWRNNEIPDPYYEKNSLLIEWIPERTWIYKKTFTVPEEMRGLRVRLVFEGVDYESKFFLNGSFLGSHKGMFTPAVFDVSSFLTYGKENMLAVIIERAPDEQPQVGITSKVKTHKCRMAYGWDFCPRMIHVGIWDEVYLEATDSIIIEDVWVRTFLAENNTKSKVRVMTRLSALQHEKVELNISIFFNGQKIESKRTSTMLSSDYTTILEEMEVQNPNLWWPNGYGEQPLYEMRISGSAHEKESDSRTIRFGIRSIEILPNETEDKTALPYTFSVNGRKIYLNGWNWVPLDVLYGVDNHSKLVRLLTLAKRANVNILRVWGGGLIEKKGFYDLCDQFGIMVWQEFCQSSSGIESKPTDDQEVINMMVEEAKVIVPRKRNHASLVLWCGGNELQTVNNLPLSDSEPILNALKEVVLQLDPDRLWLPTSPTGRVFSNSIDNIQSDPSGLHDVHGPWEHQGLNMQYELFNRGCSLLNSEFGVEGLTNLKALNATISTKDQWPASKDNPVYFHRGAWWINEVFVQKSFGDSLGSIETMIRASQLLQAEGLRYAVESNRRRMFQNSGSLPWQFNESYPNSYCTSAVDYYAIPKSAYYAIANAYVPISVNASFSMQVWGDSTEFEAGLWVTNTTLSSLEEFHVKALIVEVNGKCVTEKNYIANVPFNRSFAIGDIKCKLTDLASDVFFLDLRLNKKDGSKVASNRYIYSKTVDLKPLLELSNADLQTDLRCEMNCWHIELKNCGKTAAIDVRIDDARHLEAEGWVYFDSNNIMLLPGETKMIIAEWDSVYESQRELELSGFNVSKRRFV